MKLGIFGKKRSVISADSTLRGVKFAAVLIVLLLFIERAVRKTNLLRYDVIFCIIIPGHMLLGLLKNSLNPSLMKKGIIRRSAPRIYSHLFLSLTIFLSGQLLDDNEEMKHAITSWIINLTDGLYGVIIQNFVSRYEMSLNGRSDYIQL